MTSRKLYDASMIFLIGMSPLGFQYLKQNIESTNIVQRIQADIDKAENKSTINLKDLLTPSQQSPPSLLPTNLPTLLTLRIHKLMQWKYSSLQTHLPSTTLVATLHTLGSFLYPSAFYLSILSYFVLYQINFMNDFTILKGKKPMVEQAKFNLENINKLYIYLVGAGILLGGVGKGVGRLTKNMVENGRK